MRFLYHQVAALQTVLLGISGEVFYQVLPSQIGKEGAHRLHRLHLIAVLVGIFKGILQNQSADGSLLVVGRDVGGVFRNKDVGRDATTSIDCAADAGVVGGAGVLDAVL